MPLFFIEEGLRGRGLILAVKRPAKLDYCELMENQGG